MSFQDNLRRYRERQGITAKDFAAQLGIKYTTYANYENQGREPKYDTLCRIAAALHVSIDELMDFNSDSAAYWVSYLKNKDFDITDDGEKIYLNHNGEKFSVSHKEFVESMERLSAETDDLVSQVREGIFTLKVRDFISMEYMLS